jgi:hypothetical protein
MCSANLFVRVLREMNATPLSAVWRNLGTGLRKQSTWWFDSSSERAILVDDYKG